jgi:hypothetical protein
MGQEARVSFLGRLKNFSHSYLIDLTKKWKQSQSLSLVVSHPKEKINHAAANS